MRKWVALVALSIACGVFAEGIIDYKGTALRSSPDEMKGSDKYWCRSPGDETGDVLCSSRYPDADTIAGEHVKTALFTYYGNELHSIFLATYPDSEQIIERALETKFGKPKATTEKLRNKLGVEFENKIYTWKIKTDVIELKKYDGSLDMGSVIYRTSESVEIFTKRNAEKTKKLAKDL